MRVSSSYDMHVSSSFYVYYETSNRVCMIGFVRDLVILKSQFERRPPLMFTMKRQTAYACIYVVYYMYAHMYIYTQSITMKRQTAYVYIYVAYYMYVRIDILYVCMYVSTQVGANVCIYVVYYKYVRIYICCMHGTCTYVRIYVGGRVCC